MKKRNLLFLLAVLLIPANAKAAEMKINCDKLTAAPKSTVKCTISAYDVETSGGEGKISITNGKVTNAAKVMCNQGDVETTQFFCAHDYQENSIDLATYTIEVGESGTTTFGLTNAKFVGNNFKTISYNVTPVEITIKASSSEPTPGPTDPTPSDPEPTPTPTPAEDKKDNKKKTENPDTGAFLNTTLAVLALGGASYVAYNVAKKKKFFRL